MLKSPDSLIKSMVDRNHEAAYLLNEALIYKDFFSDVLNGKYLGPIRTFKKLKPIEYLTEEQLQKFKKVVFSVEKATKLIYDLTRKFGIDNEGNIIDKHKLFSLMFPFMGIPKEKFWVKPHPISFGFFLPPEYFHPINGEDFIPAGVAHTDGLTSLEERINYNFSQLRSGECNYKELHRLGFRINYVLIDQLQGNKDENMIGVIAHEQKHIIDRIIGSYLITAEMSAEFYQGLLRDEPFRRDLTINVHSLKEKIKAIKSRRSDPKLMKKCTELAKEQDDIYDMATEIKAMRDMSKRINYDFFKSLREKGVKDSVISYIIALADFDDLEERLRLIYDSSANGSSNEKI